MGTRIGALWIKMGNDGQKRTTGQLESDAGINIPAGHKVGVSLVKNDRKEKDAHPDYYIEVFTQKDRA